MKILKKINEKFAEISNKRQEYKELKKKIEEKKQEELRLEISHTLNKTNEMPKEFRAKKQKEIITIAILNVIFSLAIAGVLCAYMYVNKQNSYEDTELGTQVESAKMSVNLISVMRDEQETLSKIAFYISEIGMTKDETLMYLKSISSFGSYTGKAYLVDSETNIGVPINDENPHAGEVDFSDYDEILSVLSVTENVDQNITGAEKDAFVVENPGTEKKDDENPGAENGSTVSPNPENFKADETKNTLPDDAQADKDMKGMPINCSDIFVYDDTYSIAFYRAVEVGEKTYFLINIVDIDEIITDIAEDGSIEGGTGIIMKSDGTILAGNLISLESVTDTGNFFEMFEEKYGNVLFSESTMSESGRILVTGSDETSWLYAYAEISGMDDWYYVYEETNENSIITRQNAIYLVSIIVFACMLGFMDVFVIYRQNRILKKGLKMYARQNSELDAASHEKDRFISNMSHEIRTPINAVLGLDEMIIRESSEETIKDYAADIKSAGRTLLGLVNDILDYSKIASGKMNIVCDEYDLSSVINDLMNLTEQKAYEKGLDFELDLTNTIPSKLYGDELRVKQIILNILTNAVKYTEKGSVTLKVGYEKKDDENIDLIVSVKDTGIGIRPEDLDKLTKPFERLDEKRNKSIEGTGLGMSIVTSLLSAMGSKLNVESEYGKGSTFSFRLTQKVISYTEIGDLKKVRAEAKKINAAYRAKFIAPDAHILAVDDTQINLTVFKGLLKETKINIDTAQSGQDALKMIAENQYDIIFMDHRMPGMDGIETLNEIKKMGPEITRIPVVAFTANASADAVTMYKEAGFYGFLAKPVSAEKLENLLKELLPQNLVLTVDARTGGTGDTGAVTKDSRKENKNTDDLGMTSGDGTENTSDENQDKTDENEDDFPVIFGIDWNEGLKNCGSKEVLMAAVYDFIHTADMKAEEIREYFNNEDIRNYTVKVHALKSAARLIGAMQLSGDAKYLEKCGDTENLNEIRRLTDTLLNEFYALSHALKENFREEKKEHDISLNDLKEAYAEIKEKAAAFDFDAVDKIIKMLSDYNIPESEKKNFDRLRTAVMNVDLDGIMEIVG